MDALSKTGRHEEVSEYYGSTLSSSNDLKTNACCTIQQYPSNVQRALELIHPEVTEKYYGCGLTIPEKMEGKRVLDLGSGSGRDCYIAAYLVGEAGSVVGVDMTDEQLEVARRHRDWHAEQFGHERSNVEFRKGLIERLDEVGLQDDDFDLVISNCVINLCPDKPRALREIFRVLKPGGEFHFSDVYADRPVPRHLMDDPELYGECLSGALDESTFVRLAEAAGFRSPLEVDRSAITIENEVVKKKVGDIQFDSITFNLSRP